MGCGITRFDRRGLGLAGFLSPGTSNDRAILDLERQRDGTLNDSSRNLKWSFEIPGNKL